MYLKRLSAVIVPKELISYNMIRIGTFGLIFLKIQMGLLFALCFVTNIMSVIKMATVFEGKLALALLQKREKSDLLRF